jgi:flagellar hook-associated protein 3 FlgL
MRVSTAQIYDNGTGGILRNQAAAFKIQNQLSTGRRVLTPADDPVASAQALVTTQSKDINKQYVENQSNAESKLGLLEGSLTGVTDILQSARERAVQLGNATLTDKERRFIADELQSRLDDIMALANGQDGEGKYLFSGFQGATLPFVKTGNPAPAPFDANNPVVQYVGDQGERKLQVEASRTLSISAAGADVFMKIPNGNGTFAVSANAANTGTALADPGTVLDIQKWNASPVQPQDFEIRFAVDNTVIPAVTYYNLVDNASGNSMVTNAAPTAGPPFAGDWKVFTPGQPIAFNGLAAAFGTDLGIQVEVGGSPANGDRFTVETSRNQSLFDTVQNLIAIAGTQIPVSGAGNTGFMNLLTQQISALDQGLDNVLRVQASVGARMNEIDSLQSTASDLDLQYSERLSNLQDLDYAKAISDLSRQQLQLEAAQKSFVRITSLSLFSVI